MQPVRKGVALGMKYTLLCENGRIFQPGTHWLFLGQWVDYCEGYTILQHGVLSDQEVQQLETQQLVNLYQDMRNKSIGITANYHEKYLAGKNAKDLTLYAGCLKRMSRNVWKGEVHIR